MSFKEIVKNIGRVLYHNRSDIAFYGGLVGSAVGTGLLVKGAMDSHDDLVKYKNKKEEISQSEFSEDDKKKLQKENTIITVKSVGKKCLPGVVVQGVSYGAEVWGHHELHTELDGATALANGLAGTIAVLHSRIAAAEGEDKWREYAYGQNVESVVNVDNSTGETTESVSVKYDNDGIYDFSRDYNLSEKYSDVRGINKNTLVILRNCWNQKLQNNITSLGRKDPYKKVFLRDVWMSVFENLDGFKEEWANAGWIYTARDGSRMNISFFPEKESEMDAATLAFWKEQTPDVKIVFNCYANVYDIERELKSKKIAAV